MTLAMCVYTSSLEAKDTQHTADQGATEQAEPDLEPGLLHTGGGAQPQGPSHPRALKPQRTGDEVLHTRSRSRRLSAALPPEEGAAEELQLDEELGHHQTLDTALEGRVGVQIRRSGALGESAFISLRGAGARQVRVHLDGIPLHGGASPAFDLSSIPISLLGSVRVYRTTPPLSLGAPLHGGALDLRSSFEADDGWRVRSEATSIGSGRLSVATQLRRSHSRTLIALTMHGSSGRFRYYDDNGTPLYLNDDYPNRARANNKLGGFSLMTRSLIRIQQWRLTALGLTNYRQHGVPGLGTVRTTKTNLGSTRTNLHVNAERAGLLDGALTLSMSLAGSIGHSVFSDPALELSLDRERWSSLNRDLLSRTEATAWIGDHLAIPASLDLSGEWRSAAAEIDDPKETASRLTAGLSAEPELRVLDDRVRLRAGARIDFLHNSGSSSTSSPAADSSSWLPSWQVRLAGADTFKGVDLQGYVGINHARRPPSFDELFGDGGWRVGSPGLRDEERFTLSGGLGTGAHDLLGATVSASWDTWYGEASDLITWLYNAQGVARSINIGRARFLGHELEVKISDIGPLDLRTFVTISDAIQLSDDPSTHRRRLPSEAPERLGVDTALRCRGALLNCEGLSLRYEWLYSSSFYADEYNYRPLPARYEHHLSLGWQRGAWSASLSVRNLADARTRSVSLRDGGRTIQRPQPISDTLGFPLPGRLFLAALSWSSTPTTP